MNNLPKIKILYIGPIPPEFGGKDSGGVATYCYELARVAFKKGYEVYIFSNTGSLFKIEKDELIHLPILRSVSMWLKYLYAFKAYCVYRKKIKNLTFLPFRKRMSVCYLARLFHQIIQLLKPNLIHVLHILDNAIFSLDCIDFCPPTIVTEHGVGLLYQLEMHRWYGFKEKNHLFEAVTEASRRIHYIVSCSKFSKIAFLDVFKVPNQVHIISILNPINPDKIFFLEKNEAKKLCGLEDKTVLLFCGVHLPIQRKGLDILLTAVSKDEYLRKNCKLVIVTNMEGKAYTDEFCAKQGLDGLALTSLPKETLVKLYNAADVFVMPSRQEGIGLVYYEALLAGTPVVGFHKSIKELEQELNIYIGEGFDATTEGPKELAEKIKKVLNTRLERQILRKAVIEKLSWDVKFQEYDRIYKEVLTRH